MFQQFEDWVSIVENFPEEFKTWYEILLLVLQIKFLSFLCAPLVPNISTVKHNRRKKIFLGHSTVFIFLVVYWFELLSLQIVAFKRPLANWIAFMFLCSSISKKNLHLVLKLKSIKINMSFGSPWRKLIIWPNNVSGKQRIIYSLLKWIVRYEIDASSSYKLYHRARGKFS